MVFNSWDEINKPIRNMITWFLKAGMKLNKPIRNTWITVYQWYYCCVMCTF